MDERRRLLLNAGVALGAAAFIPAAVGAAAPAFDPIPPIPSSPTPGKPGDFDFLAGEWRIRHQWLRNGKDWETFDGEATCWTILGGVGSVEELRIPARDFNGMGLRMLDVGRRVWSDHWVNAKSGVVTTPGQSGSFENGAGIFYTRDTEDGKPAIYAGIWDRITANGCRWRQAASYDDGRTWAQNWIMDWTRAP
jgi:hypothetical protein